MAGFGGAIKLTGASEYQATLKRITENVKENTSAMQLLATQYDSADKSEEAVQARTKALNDVLATQNEKLQVLKAQYMDLAPRVQEQADKHQELVTRYNNEKQKLDEIGNTLGKSSDEYKKQQYIPRSERSEWGLVGLVGRLVVTDDGSCKVGGCVSARNGIGTSCYKGNARVLRRLDENHVEVLLR